ncbi:hypothetical protein [uncultured Eubacterium sp.]|uniref:hypothetical protein n=1 Tax=uncultured Eubacterium sp. TaxID=165185 RepID=UPI00261229E7|nr:hypothetical protein [uncultured Eubacterium sp.]
MNLKKLDTIKTPENWKKELLNQQINVSSEESNGRFIKIKKMKWVAVSLAIFVVCATGITVGASTSDSFKEFLQGVFGIKKVQEVKLETTTNSEKTEECKTPEGEIKLSDNMEVVGRNETFILEYSKDNSENVKNVYSIKNNKLLSEQANRFQGKYNDEDFSFDYIIKGKEICGFNYKGAVSEIFPVMKGRTIYAALYQEEKGKVVNEAIAEIDLDTNEIEKISNDKMICNFVMSPNGKTLLCNFRSKEYWSVFDLENKTQKKLKKRVMNGYTTADEISFVDDYHILTLGKPFTKYKTEYYSKYLINLKTRKVEKEFFNTKTDINFNYTYSFDNKEITIENIIEGAKFKINTDEKSIEPISASEKYAMFNTGSNGRMYLVNLEKQEWLKINIPVKSWENMNFYLMGKENKMLITFDKKAYIVDISDLENM